ncbi:MAG TPA: HlyD family efflux transporter periplasmic adaptor subunit [Gemmatimonadaceae bacterium]|nr:HlyD family efflux transporter periplasmic adaptor subunit [Gemmatimonadaceae bacterium]
MDIPRAPKTNTRRYLYAGGALAGLVLVTVALSQLDRAVPTVEASTLWIDTVARGEMLREVHGPGTLVPEQIRWIAAVTAGRVERKHVEPGEKVSASTVLVELSNPDVELQVLEAQRQLTEAEATLVNLRASLETQRLNQQGVIATVRSEYLDAKRAVEVGDGLAAKQLIAPTDLQRAKDKQEELEARYAIEQERLRVHTDAIAAQLDVQRSQIGRLREILAFRRQQVASMRVMAGTDGVLQELPLEVGQWAMSGTTLAKVVEPGRLKAVLNIPETQANLALGQRASIDTRNGIIRGRVTRIDPAARNGTVAVDIALDGPLPPGARPDLTVDGTIEIERLANALYVGRPAYGQANTTIEVFRVEPDGRAAARTRVQFGRGSVNAIEILDGLEEGDVVILSDLSQYGDTPRLKLRN